MDRAPAAPDARASRSWLLNLPEELLRRILRMVEAAYVESGQTSAEFLELMTVCKRFQLGVDSVVTNLSRGVAGRFCYEEPLRAVGGELARQLARWGSLRRVELHVHGSIGTLTQLVSALVQSCPGLTALRILLPSPHQYSRTEGWQIARLTSLTRLESLSLTGFHSFTATLPRLTSLRELTADFKTLKCPSLPALERLLFGRESGDTIWSLQAPHLQASPRLHHLSLTRVSMDKLLLPRSLQVLDLVHVQLGLPLDLGTELPELAEVRLVYGNSPNRLAVSPEGLATLLSRGQLRQLKLHLDSSLTPLGQLPLSPSLTPLSQVSQHSPQLQPQPPLLRETVASLTTLDLEDLRGLLCLDISHLRLQHLKLGYLRELSSLEGLELQTRLTSLSLRKLPLVQLPDLQSVTVLVTLELAYLELQNWSPDSLPCLPHLKLLRLKDISPRVTTASLTQGCSSPSAPSAFTLDLSSLTSLTKLDLSDLPSLSGVVVTHLPLLERLEIEDCRRLSHLAGLHSLPRLHTVKLGSYMPELQSLTISSCPRLTHLSSKLTRIQHLSLQDLPSLSSHLNPLSVESLSLVRLPQWPDLKCISYEKLKNVQLIDLPQCSSLFLVRCPELQVVQVSGCPLTAIALQKLPQLKAPNLQISDLLPHVPGSTTPLATTSAPPHFPSPAEPPAAPQTHPAPGNFPQDYKGLCSLTMSQLPGFFSLDHLVLRTGLKLEELHILPSVRELTFSEPKLVSLDVSQLATVQKLTVHYCGSLTRLAGITSLPELTSLSLTSVTKLEELAIVSCPEFTSLSCSRISPLHLHLEDLPSLSTQTFSCDGRVWLGVVEGMQPINPLGSLQTLKLRRLPSVSKLLLKDLAQLESVEVVGCSSLMEVHLENLDSLTSLSLTESASESFGAASSSTIGPTYLSGCIERLAVLNLPKLQSIPCPPTLRGLAVCSCPALTSLPMDDLPHLASIKLRDVPNEVFPAWFRPFRGVQYVEFDRPSVDLEVD